VGLAVSVLFARAPSREIAGQIGNVIFSRLGPAVAILAVALFATEMITRRSRASGAAEIASTILHAAIVLMALAVALWLTPKMGAIWREGAHAADGTGLEGNARGRFLVLHVASNLIYLAMLTSGIAIVVLRVFSGSESTTPLP